jgi:hypothetical protein
VFKISLAVLLLCSACGDDTQATTDAGGGDAPHGDGSTDGSALNCESSGWDQIVLDGTVWSVDHHVPAVGDFAGIVKFTGAGTTLSTTYNGSMVAMTVQSAGAFGWTRNAVPNTRITRRVFAACTRPSAGEIDGQLTFCDMMNRCSDGTFRMIKLERRPGETDKSDNITKLAEYQGSTWQSITANVRVDAARQLAVMARYDDGLYILHLDPGPPYTITEVGHAPVEDNGSQTSYEIYNDVKLTSANGKHYAVMSSSTHGAVIYDITNPATPAIVAHVRDGDNEHTAFIVGNTLYLGDLDNGLVIVDITDPEHPVEKSNFIYQEPNPPPNPPLDPLGSIFLHDLFVEPGRAYLSYWGAGLVIVDVNDPTAPHQIGEFTYVRMTNHSVWAAQIGNRHIALTGDEDFTAHGRELDVTDPAHITLIGEYGQDRPQVSIHNIMIDGDKAYVAYYMDGLRILQLSTTQAPTLVGWFNTWSPGPNTGYSFYESAIGLDKVGNLVYLADEDRGLIVLQVP